MKYTYADTLVLFSKKETVLQDMIDRLIEIERCCGMEMNVEDSKVANGNLKATIFNTEFGRSKITGQCEIFQLFG
jgi:hypothetical protein